MREKQKLYLMQNSAQLSKIGIAINPIRRRRQLETASGLKIEIIRCWSPAEAASAYTIEQYLHSHFARRRLEGEWFTHISPKEVELAGYDLLECNHDGSPRREP